MTRTRWEILAATAVGLSALALAIHSARTPQGPTPPIPLVDPVPLVPRAAADEQVQRPRIEVVFALDTTGSMGGLIEGAKQKIWSIANQLASGQPTPEVKMGLVAYRDLGDAYVTQPTPLMDDLDEVYGQLMQLRADGGGDGPEHVNAALAQAIRQTQWSPDPNVLRLIFLVGDAPPHNDYGDGLETGALAREAADRNIVINTVRCGSDSQTENVWRSVANLTGGRYASIAQDGGVVMVATPFDGDLQRLNEELADTMLGYGSGSEKSKARSKREMRRSMSASAGAAAASYAAKAGRLNAEDLIGAVEGGLALEAIPESELPEPMQDLAPAARKAFVSETKAKRDDVERRILELARQRDAYLRKQAEADGSRDGFDAQVLDMVQSQTARIGVAYE